MKKITKKNKPTPPKKNIKYSIILSDNFKKYEIIYLSATNLMIDNISVKNKFEALMQEKNPHNKTLSPLEFLYIVGDFPYYDSYIKFVIDEKENDGGKKREISLAGLLAKIREKQNVVPNLAIFEKEANKICARWPNDPVTIKKREIFNDFIKFCKINPNADVTSRVKLVVQWLALYSKQGTHNPFYFLNDQRRIISKIFNVFHPLKADSIVLFRKFLKGEEIPFDLNYLLLNAEKNVHWEKCGSIVGMIKETEEKLKMQQSYEENMNNVESSSTTSNELIENIIKLPKFVYPQSQRKCVIR